MAYEVKLSVRSLVEYVFSSGNLERRVGMRRAQEGTRIHQLIQKEYDSNDEKEVYLKMATQAFEDISFTIDGRCDGLLLSKEIITIDEIKSTSRPIDDISEITYPVHWAQARFYAYMYAKDRGLDTIQVQLTYVQTETREIKRFIETQDYKQLEAFVNDVLEQYLPFARLKASLLKKRNESIQSLSFPFKTYREGQRKLAGAVLKTIQDKTNLFAHAPTGIGKTMSTIFPTVKAMGEGLVKRAFYLTAKTITRTAAEETFLLLSEKGLALKTVTITAKDKICFKESGCQSDHCDFAEGYYDRINDAVMDILNHEDMITREVILAYAEKHHLCPFEFSLDVASLADVMIGDYNYVFDPRVNLKRFLDDEKKETVLLIDEAHNLVDRARGMYSVTLVKKDFLDLKRKYKESNIELSHVASEINQYFIAMKKKMGQSIRLVTQELQEELVTLMDAFVSLAEGELGQPGELGESGNENGGREHLLDIYFLAQSFLRIAKVYDHHFVTTFEIVQRDLHVSLVCLDPSTLLQQSGQGYRSMIYFSATLSPFDYYRHMLGASSEDYSISIGSPFKKEQLDIRISPLSTRFRDRERTRPALVALLRNLVGRHPGNYLIFFPSYQYMNDVVEQLEGIFDHLVVQDSRMSENDREAFLNYFHPVAGQSKIGFAVMGGIFSEGIDLIGDRLTGVVVIGVGLPQISFERDLIKEYFNKVGKNGYDYAYVYPGMNKVLQAGGRLIRSETDKGILVLVDDRFFQNNYQSLLPAEWKGYQTLEEN